MPFYIEEKAKGVFMSQTYEVLRRIGKRGAPESDSAMGNLMGALIEELSKDVPDDPRLETVRADILTASRTYETSDKRDLALRFYLAVRSLLIEVERLQQGEGSKIAETGVPLHIAPD
jgi:hypothetical protein